jgi:hypothetical protein
VDEQRFDTWTRAFAAAGSRRRLMRAVAGGAALLVAGRRGLSDTVAHHGMAGPGDPCRTSDQCVAADAPMSCDWNGYGNGTTCCTYEGSNCADDSWCCGSNLCVGGTCTSQSAGCTGEGCACQLYRDPGCLASCPLYDPCDAGLVCTGTSEDTGTCVATQSGGCTGEGCACYQGSSDANACDPGLVCCLNQVPVLDGNGGCVPVAQCSVSCTGQGCDCTSDGDCDSGLMCCVQGDPGAPGTCQTMDACPSSLCTGEGCDCDFHDPNACQDGLMCCAVQNGFICGTAADCGG